ncbi:MAG: putative lysyl tRNA synthetase-like protein, partial [Jatrophihabitans sp.]|nr:putative lysyl tRNA synthetase-like protein [Jatrophihabitans sp.]
MRMAKKVETIVTLTDDLDGSKADRTLAFGYDGASYEIDLSKKNATALAKALAPYLAAARKVPARARRANGGGRASTGRRTDLGTVRQWARRNGHDIADRGRIP